MNDFDIDGVKSLLEKVKLINFKYEKILKANEYDFNIFSILRNDTDEVNLHSRFLYEILNPAGVHHKENLFLTLFLETVGISDFAMEDISAKREYKKIDLCITNSRKQAIIIENKIYAEDQDKQIQTYFGKMKDEGFDDIKVIYLTLYGDMPSSQSLGSLEGNEKLILKTPSYRDDIDNWLEKCIKEAATFPILRETFVQYRTLIQKLTGKYHSKEYIMEIKILLLSKNEEEKYIRLATDISLALTEAQIEIQYQFWKELASCLENIGYHIQNEDKFSRADVESYYNQSKNNKDYGIDINVCDIDNEKLLLRILIYNNIYYGLFFKKGSTYASHKESKYNDLSNLLKEIDDSFKRENWCLGWKYPVRRFNFKDSKDENVFALADVAKREKYVKELADEIDGIIKSFKELYKTEMSTSVTV
ncbi:MAG: PD-(D/E)XK nuclease family protein [Desulfococcaceae bacterium]